MMQLNPRELDVLNILWKSEEPMMATDIVSAQAGLTQSTVTAVLRKLLQEGLVEVTGITHSGRVLSRIYRPTAASKELILKDFTSAYNSFNGIISEAVICAAILTNNKSPEHTKAELSKLRELLANFENNS